MTGFPELDIRIWLLTGDPAVGKSTAIAKIIFDLRSAGFAPGGMLTREIRSHGERQGFQLTDISTDQSEVLAGVKGITGPRLGKYHVNLNALSSLGVAALKNASIKSDLVAVDEVGPMELLSPDFRRAIRLAIIDAKTKPALCAVHKRFEDPLIEELRSLKEAKEFEITFENRNELPKEVSKDIIRYLKTKNESGGKMG
jgi:nucleoside-triphosphatase